MTENISSVIIAPEKSNRVDHFQQALKQAGLPAAKHVSYIDLLRGKTTLADLPDGTLVRIESPGKCFEVEKLLLQMGAEDAENEKSAFLPSRHCGELEFDRGLILFQRQWYLGYCRALAEIASQTAGRALRIMNAPEDIAVMFDKTACQNLMQNSGIKIPKMLGAVNSFDELRERMRQIDIHKVFVKLAHGSSAAGAVAYQTDRTGRRHKALTTAEMVWRLGTLNLYNSRRIKTYENESEIADLINQLCLHRVHVEAWLPKAVLDNHGFDVRVVVIGGKAAHTVVRLSQSPFTNLHLLNRRASVEDLVARIGLEHTRRLNTICESAMKAFPRSVYAGVDVLVQPDLKSLAVLEVNAFGDLLPGIKYSGMDTYQLEIASSMQTLASTQ